MDLRFLVKPLYDMVFAAIKTLVLHAPSWAGGYEGKDELDVCSQITGISSTHLVKSPEMCQERIDALMHGYAVIAMTAMIVVASMHGGSLLKYFISWSREWRANQIRHYEEGLRRDKYAKAAVKRRDTMHRNKMAHATLTTIRTILESETPGMEGAQRLAMVQQAMARYDLEIMEPLQQLDHENDPLQKLQ